MNERTLYKLEFHKVKDMLKAHAVTQTGKAWIDALMPSANFEEVTRMQKETAEALAMAIKKGKLPLTSVKEITSTVKRIEIGATLSCQEIMNVAALLRTCRRLKSYYKEDAEEVGYTHLNRYFESLSVHGDIEHEISRCIIAEDEFSDDATPELSQIRKQIKATHNKIRETIHGILYSSKYQDMLQETVVTMRQDRYCVPVKVEYKNAFGGIVHDQSSTGATAFIEPMAVVELNNNLRTLYSKEQDEIERILIMLTNMIEPISPFLQPSFDFVCALDTIFAKAEFSLKIDGREPKLNQKGYVNLKRARHPMLPKSEVVPIDVYVGKDFTTLLITGPNTGGKTVTLKTLGLFTLMAQSGMQIPAAEGSEIAVFDEVFSDLGDEQSIEQNLSTFSAHMTNIVRILDNMTPNSLILLDEVGSGTDPVEGAALAMSILEYLRRQKIRTVATTHYSELKLYAISTDGVENASCEFDVESLRPTYRLLIGIPGKSNAFAISLKLGLYEHLIEEAKKYLHKENVKMEDILVELEYSKKMAELEKEKAEKFRHEAQILKEEITTQRKKLEKSKQKILDKANEKAKTILKQVEQEADAVLKEVRSAARAAQVSIDERSLIDAKESMNQKIGKQNKVIGKNFGQKKPVKKQPKNIQMGDVVMVTSFMQQGTVLEAPDASGNVLVQVGILPVKMHISNLEMINEDTPKVEPKKKSQVKYAASSGHGQKVSKAAHIRTEVDVRGLMVDEALPIVDKYLDDAYLSGLKTATIIHGKGTGALRQAITTMLKRHPHIKSHRPGMYGEGEMGVTVVEIK